MIRTLLSALMLGAIRFYQLAISPYLGTNCRFQPSCSTYARDAIRVHGPVRGFFLAVWRIMRCNPWNNGGYDPVPSSCDGRCGHS